MTTKYYTVKNVVNLAHTNCNNGGPINDQVTYAKCIAWECPQCMLPNTSSSFFSLSDTDLSNSFSVLDSTHELPVFSPGEIIMSSSPKMVRSGRKQTVSNETKSKSIKIMLVNCRCLKSDRKQHDFQDLLKLINQISFVVKSLI